MIDAVPDQMCVLYVMIKCAFYSHWIPNGAVYMKNCIFKYWREIQKNPTDTDVNFYTIHHQVRRLRVKTGNVVLRLNHILWFGALLQCCG